MALYPEVQKKAQAELDNVIGSQRLPDFSDRSTLPYVNALVKELARWHVVAPTGVPHAAVRDDVYNGFLIPKGSLVIPNLWYVCRSSFQSGEELILLLGRTPETHPSILILNASIPTDSSRTASLTRRFATRIRSSSASGDGVEDPTQSATRADSLTSTVEQDLSRPPPRRRVAVHCVRVNPAGVHHLAACGCAWQPSSSRGQVHEASRQLVSLRC